MTFIINQTYDTGVTSLQTSDPTLYGQYTTAVQTAIQFYENAIKTNITVNINFGWGEVAGNPLPPGAIGASSTWLNTYTYAQVYSALKTVDDASGASAVQKASLASLPATDPTGGATFFVSFAEQQALGLSGGATPTTNDGSIGLDATISWSWGQTPVSSDGNDPVATLEHEISEVLGRFATGGNGGQYTVLDMFRYTAANGLDSNAIGAAAGVRDQPFVAGYDANAPSYFSYNGATVTLLFETPTNVANGADVADWAPSVGPDAFGDGSGVPKVVSTTDLQLLNVLGYDIACYGQGTGILTDRGEIAIEDLIVGDRAVTASGECRPIVWIGRRAIDLTRHPEPYLVCPVRIAAGALSENVPHRDLVVSPEHAFWIDDTWVAARDLINGASIRQEAWSRIVYFHLELESHDVLIAEGAFSESYLDCDNRKDFENAPDGVTALHPDWLSQSDSRRFASLAAASRLRAALSLRARAMGRGVEIDAFERRLRAPRTDFVRNPRCEGAQVGLIGAEGRAPEGWWIDAPPGLAVETVRFGDEDDLPYVDLRLTGLAGEEAILRVYPEPGKDIAARVGEDWTMSVHVRLTDGSLEGVEAFALYIDEYRADGAYLIGRSYRQKRPDGEPLALQRLSATRKLLSGETAAMTGYVEIKVAAGATIDMTLRLAAPRIERGVYLIDLLPQGAALGAKRHVA